VFVKSSVEIPFSLEPVRAEMLDSPESWLRPLLVEARAESRILEAELGFQIPTSQGVMRLQFRGARVEEARILLFLRVWVDDLSHWWAGFDSVLSAAWFGERRTQLAITGQYEAPAGMSRRDQMLLHRVVEAVSRHFVAGVAAELSERVSPASRSDPFKQP
jgi:hypothetical protein